MYILHSVTTLKNNTANVSPEGKMKFKTMRYQWFSPLKKSPGGAPGWRSRLSVRFQTGHDLAVHGFEPRVGLWADGSEPGACFRFCVSLSVCPSPVHALSLSVPKINKKRWKKNKKKKVTRIEPSPAIKIAKTLVRFVSCYWSFGYITNERSEREGEGTGKEIINEGTFGNINKTYYIKFII